MNNKSKSKSTMVRYQEKEMTSWPQDDCRKIIDYLHGYIPSNSKFPWFGGEEVTGIRGRTQEAGEKLKLTYDDFPAEMTNMTR